MADLIWSYRDSLYTVSGLITGGNVPTQPLYNSVEANLARVNLKVSLARSATAALSSNNLFAAKQAARDLSNTYVPPETIPQHISDFVELVMDSADASLAVQYKKRLATDISAGKFYLSNLSNCDTSFYATYLQPIDITALASELVIYRRSIESDNYSLISPDVSLALDHHNLLNAHQDFYSQVALLNMQVGSELYSPARSTVDSLVLLAENMYQRGGLLQVNTSISNRDQSQPARELLLSNLATLETVISDMAAYQSTIGQCQRIITSSIEELLDSDVTLADVSLWHGQITRLSNDYNKFPIANRYNNLAGQAQSGLATIYNLLGPVTPLSGSGESFGFATLGAFTTLTLDNIAGLPGDVLEPVVTYALYNNNNNNNSGFQWSSGNADTASVSGDNVYLGSPGQTSLTVSINSLHASNQVYVYDVSLRTISGLVGQTFEASLNVRPSVGYPVFPYDSMVYRSSNPEIATVSGQSITLVTVGSCQITGALSHYPGNQTLHSTVTVQETIIPINRINFARPSTVVGLGQERALNYTLDPPNATPDLLWTTSDENIVMVTDGTLLGVSPGQATVTVTAPQGASASIVVNVRKFVSRIELYPSQLFIGMDVLLDYTLTPSDATLPTLQWSSADTSIITVSGDLLRGVTEGFTSVKVHALDGGDVSASIILDVYRVFGPTDLVRSISLEPSMSVLVNTTQTIPYTIVPPEAANANLDWVSADTSKVTVSGNQVTGVSPGSSRVTVTALDGSDVSASILVFAREPIQNSTLVSSIQLDSSVSVFVGASRAVPYTVTPTGASGASLAWTSAVPSRVTVSGNSVTGVSAGTSRVTALAQDGSNVSGSILVYSLTPPVSAIQMTTSMSVFVGDSRTIVYTVTPTGASGAPLAWTSAEPSRVTVSGARVTGVSTGTSRVTATALDGSNVSGSILVYARPPLVSSLQLDASMLVLVGESALVSYVVAPVEASGAPLSWTSAAPSRVAVSGNRVTGVSSGSSLVTVRAQDGSNVSGSFLVYSRAPPVSSILLDSSISVFIGNSRNISYAVTPAGASEVQLGWASANTSVATVSGNRVTGVSLGSTRVTATALDGTNVSAGITVGVYAPMVSAISLDPSSLVILVDQSATVAYTISPSNAGAIDLNWVSNNVNLVSVSGNTIYGISAGETTVRVFPDAQDAEGDVSATLHVRVTIPPPNAVLMNSLTLQPVTRPLHLGRTVTLRPSISPSRTTNRDLIWSIRDSDIAAVSSEGRVTAIAPGEVTVTVTSQDGSNLSDSIVIQCIVPVTRLSVAVPDQLFIGETQRVNLTVTPSNATLRTLQDMDYISYNTEVITVDSSGWLTAHSNGSAQISVFATDNSRVTTTATYTVASVQTVNILLNKIVLTSISQTAKLPVIVSPSNAFNKTISWGSDNLAVATVDSNGVVTSVGFGSCRVTASGADMSDGVKRDSVIVYVSIPVTQLSINLPPVMLVGQTYQTVPTILPPNATTQSFLYSSHDTDVATIDSSGWLTARANGRSVITVMAVDGGNARGSALCRVSSVQQVTLTGSDTITMTAVPSTTRLRAVVGPSSALNQRLLWGSSNSNVATVNQTGQVTAASVGTCLITVTAEDTSNGVKSDSVTVIVAVPVKAITMTLPPMRVGETFQAVPVVSPADATVQALSYASSNTRVATVGPFGLIRALANGRCVIMVTATDGSRVKLGVVLNVASVTRVTVSSSEQIRMLPSRTFSLSAYVNPTNAINQIIRWSSTDMSVATVSDGLVTALRNGTSTIRATADDDSLGSKFSQIDVSVTTPITSITLQPTNITLVRDTSTQLIATVNPGTSSIREVRWTSSASRYATVDSSGVVTAVAPGQTQVRALAEGKSGSCTVRVT